MKLVKLTADVVDADSLEGRHVDLSHCDRVVKDTTTVLKPDGSPLLIYVADALPRALCRSAFAAYKDTRPSSGNRVVASGGATSATSGVIGFLEKSRLFPECRMTAFTHDHFEEYRAAHPLFAEVSRQFQALAPCRYEAQREFVQGVAADYVIPQTVFTTVTVNLNWRTAAHRDAGDYRPGLGVLTVLEGGGHYSGGELVFPQFRTAVDMRTGGLLLADVHELHGNAPLSGERYTRLSLVFYAREKMPECDRADAA